MLLVGALLLALFVLPTPWSVVLVVAAAAVEVAETAFWIRYSRRRRARVGPEALIGARGEAVTDCRPEGQVRLSGELWQARCDAGVEAGASVRVVAREGLTLVVERDPVPGHVPGPGP
jgi:membrane-bound ClpP family serine protease